MNIFKRLFSSSSKPTPSPQNPLLSEGAKRIYDVVENHQAKMAQLDREEDEYYEKYMAQLKAENDLQTSPADGSGLPSAKNENAFKALIVVEADGSKQPADTSESAQPSITPKPSPSAAAKIHVPKPSRIYVAGNMFIPERDDIIQGVQGFLYRHDNLDRESCVPPGIAMEGFFAIGADAAQFCDVALSTIFDDGKHPGAYYLDAVLLAPNGKQMMVAVLWEGDEAKIARERIPSGTQR